MQVALGRGALVVSARGEATVAQVDHALMHGIGPRLAAVGLFGGYILNVEDRDPATWLRPIAAFDFGAELVHDAPFPEWTPALEAAVAAHWRDRLRPPGAAESGRASWGARGCQNDS